VTSVGTGRAGGGAAGLMPCFRLGHRGWLSDRSAPRAAPRCPPWFHVKQRNATEPALESAPVRSWIAPGCRRRLPRCAHGVRGHMTRRPGRSSAGCGATEGYRARGERGSSGRASPLPGRTSPRLPPRRRTSSAPVGRRLRSWPSLSDAGVASPACTGEPVLTGTGAGRATLFARRYPPSGASGASWAGLRLGSTCEAGRSVWFHVKHAPATLGLSVRPSVGRCCAGMVGHTPDQVTVDGRRRLIRDIAEEVFV